VARRRYRGTLRTVYRGPVRDTDRTEEVYRAATDARDRAYVHAIEAGLDEAAAQAAGEEARALVWKRCMAESSVHRD
jgi:5-carboxymethyl-2-hydroxymuconate isomerase